MFPVPVLNEGSTPPSPLKMRKLFLACKEIDKIGNAENQVHLRFITRLLGILSPILNSYQAQFIPEFRFELWRLRV